MPPLTMIMTAVQGGAQESLAQRVSARRRHQQLTRVQDSASDNFLLVGTTPLKRLRYLKDHVSPKKGPVAQRQKEFQRRSNNNKVLAVLGPDCPEQNMVMWIKSLKKAVEDQKEELEAAKLQLEEKEVECISLRRQINEREDNCRVEWANPYDERLTQEKGEGEKFFYEKQYEAKMEELRLSFEKELSKINMDRANLQQSNRILQEQQTSYQKTIENLKKEINEREGNSQGEKFFYEKEYKAKMEEQKLSFEKVEKELSNVNMDRANLQQSNRILQEQQASYLKTIENLKNKIKEREDNCQVEKQYEAKMEEQRLSFEKELSKVKTDMANLQQSNRILQEQQASYLKTIANMKKEIYEREDNCRIEWTNPFDEEITLEKGEGGQFFYEKQYEAKMGEQKLSFEKELSNVNMDKANLQQSNIILQEQKESNQKTIENPKKEINERRDYCLVEWTNPFDEQITLEKEEGEKLFYKKQYEAKMEEQMPSKKAVEDQKEDLEAEKVQLEKKEVECISLRKRPSCEKELSKVNTDNANLQQSNRILQKQQASYQTLPQLRKTIEKLKTPIKKLLEPKPRTNKKPCPLLKSKSSLISAIPKRNQTIKDRLNIECIKIVRINETENPCEKRKLELCQVNKVKSGSLSLPPPLNTKNKMGPSIPILPTTCKKQLGQINCQIKTDTTKILLNNTANTAKKTKPDEDAGHYTSIGKSRVSRHKVTPKPSTSNPQNQLQPIIIPLIKGEIPNSPSPPSPPNPQLSLMTMKFMQEFPQVQKLEKPQPFIGYSPESPVQPTPSPAQVPFDIKITKRKTCTISSAKGNFKRGRNNSLSSTSITSNEAEPPSTSVDSLTEYSEFESPLSPKAEEAATDDGVDWSCAEKSFAGRRYAKQCLHELLLHHDKTALDKVGEEVMNRLQPLYTLPEKVLALSIYDIVQSNDTKEDFLKKSIISKRNLQLLSILKILSTTWENLPLTTFHCLVDFIIPNRVKTKFNNAHPLGRIGEFYGSLIREFNIEKGCMTLAWKSLYWRPPDAIPLIYNMLRVNSDSFNLFDCNDKRAYPLKERLLMFCLHHIPQKYRFSEFNKLDHFLKLLSCQFKTKTTKELFEEVILEIMELEEKASLEEASEIVSFLCIFFGIESYQFMGQQVEFVTKEFMNSKISDGVYAAIIRSIGDMAVNSFEVVSEAQLQPLKTYLENAKSTSYESVVLHEAFVQALQKIGTASERKAGDQFPILMKPRFTIRKGKSQHTQQHRGALQKPKNTKPPKKQKPQNKQKPKNTKPKITQKPQNPQGKTSEKKKKKRKKAPLAAKMEKMRNTPRFG